MSKPMAYVVLVTNNDGGEAQIFLDLGNAKAWVWCYLTHPDNHPLITEEERMRAGRELTQIDGEYVQSVQGSEAWKEWIYIAPIWGFPPRPNE